MFFALPTAEPVALSFVEFHATQEIKRQILCVVVDNKTCELETVHMIHNEYDVI